MFLFILKKEYAIKIPIYAHFYVKLMFFANFKVNTWKAHKSSQNKKIHFILLYVAFDLKKKEKTLSSLWKTEDKYM